MVSGKQSMWKSESSSPHWNIIHFYNQKWWFFQILSIVAGEAVTSHSGPNDLDAELQHGGDDEVKREKRGYFFPSNFQNDGGLLARSEHPNEYLKKWIVHEHNRYRRMVSNLSFQL